MIVVLRAVVIVVVAMCVFVFLITAVFYHRSYYVYVCVLRGRILNV